MPIRIKLGGNLVENFRIHEFCGLLHNVMKLFFSSQFRRPFIIELAKFIMRSSAKMTFMIIRVEAFAVKAKFITRRSKLVTAIAEISGLRVGAKALIKTGGIASIE